MEDKTWKLDRSILTRVPKVLLHEHLDGTLRPKTVLDLAKECGYQGLPTQDVAELGEAFYAGAAKGNLPQYLQGFVHTIAVMQTVGALRRVAYEFMEDMAAENTLYAEVRFAPHFHTQEGLGLDSVMEAVIKGLEEGRKAFGVEFGLIVCSMRHESAELSLKLAELTAAWLGRGCCGFDLAGEETGHPPKHHVEAFQLIKRMNGSITIHAGESFGRESIWQALQFCGAHRIGHGTRLVEDLVVYDHKVIQVGSLARYILDHRIPIEVCLSSNVHTGATSSMKEHPFPYYLSEGYRVTLNTDNRLMSHTTLTQEYEIAVNTFGCTLKDLERITLNGMRAAFYPYTGRVKMIEERIIPGYAAIAAELADKKKSKSA